MKNKWIYLQLIFACAVGTVHGADAYKIVNIGDVGNSSSLPTDINQKGQVCGYVKEANATSSKLFFWDKVTGIQITDKKSVTLPKIGPNGEVYGTHLQLEIGWFWNSQNYTGFVWTPNSGIRDFSNPAWSNTVIKDVNDLGDVLVTDQFKLSDSMNYAILKDEKFDRIGTDMFFETINKINNVSEVLGGGLYELDSKLIAYPTIFTESKSSAGESKSSVDSIQFRDSLYATDTNDLGQVVGVIIYENPKKLTGFLWDRHGGTFTKFYDFIPGSINNSGQMVGFDSQQNVILKENGQSKNLNLISHAFDDEDPTQWQSLVKVIKINDDGLIIGYGMREDRLQAFILEPLDDLEVVSDMKPINTPIEINDDNFDILIAEGTTLVSFYADWCGHCKKMHSVIDAIAQNTKGRLVVAKANSERAKKSYQKEGVKGFPTLILYKDGVEVKRFQGYRDLSTIMPLIEAELR